MTDEKYDQLIRKYPALFQKSNDIDINVDDGWFDIIDTLFSLIYYELVHTENLLKYSEHCCLSSEIKSREDNIIKAKENLPILTQIKEKFGTLCIYASNTTQEVESYITFAQSMSEKVCEKCGCPGKLRRTGWLKVLCDIH